MNPYIHVTDLARMEQCPHLAWKNHEHASPVIPYANSHDSFSSLWKSWLNLQSYPEGKVGDSPETSCQLLKSCGGGIHLRLESSGIRTQIPVLIAIGRLFEHPVLFEAFSRRQLAHTGTLVLERISAQKDTEVRRSFLALFPHMSKSPASHELKTLALDDAIAAARGISVCAHALVYLKADYVRRKELDPDGLLGLSFSWFKKPGTPMRKTMDALLADQSLDLEREAQLAENLLYGTCPAPHKCKACSAPRHCTLYEECFSEQELADDDPAFLFSSRHRQEIVSRQIHQISKVPPHLTDGFVMQYAQIQAAASDRGFFMDARGVQKWMNSLQWPLIYLDFEWDTFSIPPYTGMMPFDVLCFQYSMHIQRSPQQLPHDCEHQNFFSGGDCREAFIQSLINGIPETGSILVYNMEGAEKLRLMQLARQFPQYEDQLRQIWDRMVDMSAIFEHGLYYDMKQRGRFSLKSVLPAFDQQTGYKELDVQDGLQAIQAYRQYEASEDPLRRQSIAQAISQYCAMDTMAEVLILHGLQQRLFKEI